MLPAWEALFPLCLLTAITRIGSDHTPLLLDSGEEVACRQARFMFQTWWLNVMGFGEHFLGKLTSFFVNLGIQRGSIEAWNCIARNSRQFLKG
jgi:hypothetical protein